MQVAIHFSSTGGVAITLYSQCCRVIHNLLELSVRTTNLTYRLCTWFRHICGNINNNNLASTIHN